MGIRLQRNHGDYNFINHVLVCSFIGLIKDSRYTALSEEVNIQNDLLLFVSVMICSKSHESHWCYDRVQVKNISLAEDAGTTVISANPNRAEGAGETLLINFRHPSFPDFFSPRFLALNSAFT